MKQGGEGQVREEGEGDGAPAWGSPARVVACEDLAGEEGSRSLGSYLLDEGKDRVQGPLLGCCRHGNEEARGSGVGAGTGAEEVTREAGEDDGNCCLRTQRPWLFLLQEENEGDEHQRENQGRTERWSGDAGSCWSGGLLRWWIAQSESGKSSGEHWLVGGGKQGEWIPRWIESGRRQRQGQKS